MNDASIQNFDCKLKVLGNTIFIFIRLPFATFVMDFVAIKLMFTTYLYNLSILKVYV